MKNRALAILLCVILCISMFPVYASADCEHALEKIEAKNTCAEAYQEHYRCIHCGALFLDAEGLLPADAAILAMPKPVHGSELKYVGPDTLVTCTKEGCCKEHWICTECGQRFSANDRNQPIPDDKLTEFVIPTLPHDMNPEVHPAVLHDCWNNGSVAYYTCNVCFGAFADPEGNYPLESTLDPAGHEKKEYPPKDATCTEDGNSYYFYCPVCQKFYNEYEQEIPENSWIISAGHNYIENYAVDPTCITTGNLFYYTCDRCGGVFDAEHNPISAESVALGMLPHSLTIYVEPQAKSCTANGNIEYWQCDACLQKFADPSGVIPLTEEEIIIPASHNLITTEAKAASCTEDGNVAYWTCLDCGAVLDEFGNILYNTVIPATGHMLEKQEATVTCTEAGGVEHYKCGACGRLFRDEAGELEVTAEELWTAPLGHDFGGEENHVAYKAASCTEDGNVEYYVCTRCFSKLDAQKQKILTEEEILIPKSHKLTEHPAKEVTCTEDGNVAYWTCEVCGAILDEAGNNIYDAVVPATGHMLEKQEATVTCTEAGCIEHYKCGACGRLFRDEAGEVEVTAEELWTAPLGHDFGGEENHITYKAASCTENGNVEYYVCTKCFSKLDAQKEKILTEEEILIPKSHKLTEHPAKAATCTEAGNVAYWTCEVCGAVLDENGNNIYNTVIPATGHKPEKVGAAISCTEAGTAEHYKCSSCGKLFQDMACTVETTAGTLKTEAPGHNYDADGWCTRCGAVSPDTPEFRPDPVTVTVFDEENNTYNDIVVQVSAPQGIFPANSVLSVTPLTQAPEAVDAKREEGAKVVASYTVDIKVLKNGVEIQPANGGKVNVSVSFAGVNDVNLENTDAKVYHVPDDGSKADVLETSVADNAVNTVTDGFSSLTFEFTLGPFTAKVNNGKATVDGVDNPPSVGLGKMVTVTAAVPEGKTFEKWTIVSGLTEKDLNVTASPTNFFMPGKNIELTAGFKNLVSFENSVTGVQNWPADQMVPDGTVLDEPSPVPSASNYRFDGWYDPAGNAVSFPLTINSNTRICAHWTPIYNVVFRDDLYNYYLDNYQITIYTPSNPTQRVLSGGKAKAPDGKKMKTDAYKFTGWYTNTTFAEDAKFDFNTPITADTTLFAGWQAELKVTKGNKGTVTWGQTHSFTLNCNSIESKNMELIIYQKGNDKQFAQLTKGEHYVVNEAGTVFTLTAEFIKQLGGATYVIRFMPYFPYTAEEMYVKPVYYFPYLNSAEAEFTVKTTAVKTGDESNIGLWSAIAALSAAAVIVIVIYLLRKRKKGLPPMPPENRMNETEKTVEEFEEAVEDGTDEDRKE